MVWMLLIFDQILALKARHPCDFARNGSYGNGRFQRIARATPERLKILSFFQWFDRILGGIGASNATRGGKVEPKGILGDRG